MEILSVKTWIFQCFSGVFSAILAGIRQNVQEYVHFPYFYNFCADIPFFSPVRDQLLGRAGQVNIDPVSAPVSALK